MPDLAVKRQSRSRHPLWVLALFFAIIFPLTSKAAELFEVAEFGPNPSGLSMHLYVPDRVGPKPPVLLAVHYCTGSGPVFHQHSGFSELADRYGFIVIYPSAPREGHCFDVASPEALRRDGGSDPVALKAMVDFVLDEYGADPGSIHISGVSSGAMTTQVMLALYPEVFVSGVAFAGVPYTCFATSDASLWGTECAQGRIDRTAGEWGDLVREANPGFSGPHPRIQMWHGEEDDALHYRNHAESIEQWSNVYGLDREPTAVVEPTRGQRRLLFRDESGALLMEAISLEGVGHDLPVDTEAAVRFMGLDRPASARHLWRPFSDESPWNTRIPEGAEIDPESDELIADFAQRGPLYINMHEWSIPVYEVDAAETPLHDVGDLRPGIFGRGFEPPREVPIPDGATASLPVGGDEHLAIVDRQKGREWGMWHARQVDGRWMTGLGALTDLNGTGVAPPWDKAQPEYEAHRARASGFPLIAGLVRVEEIQAGYIPHALVFAYDSVRTEHYVPPASTAQASSPATRNNREGMPMGARIRLDPAFDVQSSPLSPAGKTIARALQEFGAYLGDFAGGNVIYAESAPEALEAWEGLLASDELEKVFTPDMMKKHFQLLDMGEVRRGQNYSGSK